jgi:hypothetical protein
MYIVLLQDGILCRHLSGPSFMVPFNSRVSLLIFCLHYLSISDRRALKSPTTTELGSICILKSNSICLKKLGAPTLGAYKLTIVISSWCISPCTIMKWSFSLLTSSGLKSTLSDRSIATPACFGEQLAWLIFYPFTIRKCLFLCVRLVSYKQQIVVSSF